MARAKKTTTKIARAPAVLDAGARRRFVEVLAQLRRAPLARNDKAAIARDLRAFWDRFTPVEQKKIAAQWRRIAQRGTGRDEKKGA